ncbi:MAG: PPOX class F420-dependent oxidoreductase [Candidatus Binatia bacterium]
MEIADVQKFIAENHRGVFVARKRDGSPQITLVTPGIDVEGQVILTSRGTTYKVKNLRRDPRVSILIMGEQFSGSKFVQLDGKAEIIALPKAMELLVDWHRRVRGEHPNWDEYRARMKDEERVLIRVAIEKVGPQLKRR